MKTIGLLGGMSWKSTVGYYEAINEGVKKQLGGFHSAKIALYSVDFEPIEKLQQSGDWNAMAEILVKSAQSVQAAGADFLLICTNTMHKIAAEVEEAVEIPLLHIADATAETLLNDGVKTVGLLGTSFTMEEEFYKGRLKKRFGLEVITPNELDRQLIHRVIYDELCQGACLDESRTEYLRIIDRLAGNGADAVILGCTEIGLLVAQADTAVPLYDTTAIHANKAVELALDDEID